MENNPKEMVTKKDLHHATAKLVTKDEFKAAIAKMVTKDEFKAAIDRIELRMFTRDDHAKFVKGLQIWQKYIEGEVAAIREDMYTKQDHSRDQVWMDKAMAEIEAAREERLLSGRQKLRIDDMLFDHEKRIRVLENG